MQVKDIITILYSFLWCTGSQYRMSSNHTLLV